jgi:hypothetical protein
MMDFRNAGSNGGASGSDDDDDDESFRELTNTYQD